MQKTEQVSYVCVCMCVYDIQKTAWEHRTPVHVVRWLWLHRCGVQGHSPAAAPLPSDRERSHGDADIWNILDLAH